VEACSFTTLVGGFVAGESALTALAREIFAKGEGFPVEIFCEATGGLFFDAGSFFADRIVETFETGIFGADLEEAAVFAFAGASFELAPLRAIFLAGFIAIPVETGHFSSLSDHYGKKWPSCQPERDKKLNVA